MILGSMHFATSVYATSASNTTRNSRLSATVTSNAWIQTISNWDGMGEFQVSAVYSSTNSTYSKPQWIKTTWDFYAIGVCAGVSCKAIEASLEGYGTTNSSSGYWKNSNGAKTAWWRGRVGGTIININ